jgi:tRNA pseudouridine55 synthase
VTAAKHPEPHGVLVVDKARGPTSHDVVAVARRALGTKAIGHTGTLDPMATGVLVLCVGEATKLVNMLSAGEKRYQATLKLGQATHTLDADGEITGETDVPALTLEEVRDVAKQFVGEFDQQVPLVSAVKVDGQALHKAARKGRDVAAPVRRVCVHELAIDGLSEREIRLSVHSAKGFYVRSLGRDLAARLGTLGHLTQLRRTHNGAFSLHDAVDFEALRAAARGSEEQRMTIRDKLIPLTRVCASLPGLTLSERGAVHARHGRAIPESDYVCDGPLVPEQPRVAFDPAGVPVAIVELVEGVCRVARGFRAPLLASEPEQD